MAIDTRDKRSSAIQVGLPWRGFFPAPDGALNQADRQHTCLVYRGILAEEAALTVASPSRKPFILNLFTDPFELALTEPMHLHLDNPFALNLAAQPFEFDANEEPFILRLNNG